MSTEVIVDHTALDGCWFIFRDRELLLLGNGQLPKGREISQFPGDLRQIQRVGGHDGRECYAAVCDAQDVPAGVGRFEHLKKLLDRLPEKIAQLAARALEVIEWDNAHLFCGTCGASTHQETAAIVRRCSNPACRVEHYPRISPVVIVAVERDDEILLGRSPHFAPGMYSTLAGFVDAGESVEAAVHREIFEEAGLTVGNLRYFSSQPWPFPHSLMLGFQADYLGGELLIQREELEDAAFFHVDRLPTILPGPSTIAHWLIRDFCLRQGRSLPFV